MSVIGRLNADFSIIVSREYTCEDHFYPCLEPQQKQPSYLGSLSVGHSLEPA